MKYIIIALYSLCLLYPITFPCYICWKVIYKGVRLIMELLVLIKITEERVFYPKVGVGFLYSTHGNKEVYGNAYCQ